MLWKSVIFSLLLQLLVIPGSTEDFCTDMSNILQSVANPNQLETEIIQKHIFRQSIPKLGRQAGHYHLIPDVNEWAACAVACCARDCDVSLFSSGKCFLIQCLEDPADACKPVKSEDSRHEGTVMVSLRDPQTDAAPVTHIPFSLETHPRAAVKIGDVCTFGLLQCGQHAECVLRPSSRSRIGHCQCVKGYVRSTKDTCISGINIPDATSTTTTTTTSAPINLIATTKKDSPKVTVKHPITKLTVSAGKNKTLQLPQNSVTLSAFVLPKAQDGEKYTYEWAPVTFPDNAQTANMDGKNTDTLRLSNLIAGLYVLKIKVTGDNKFGSAVINVTVLPPTRQNQPPVAIIKPAVQEVYLPNSAILDGSSSTDDDKIVSYKWEEVSGPLQKQKTNTDGAMLTLKDMAPGGYTFRLTVTDSDGATNSTSANVTVKKEKDYPPKADAGSDVVIHLPQNSLNLYGNSSSDDNGQLTYEWIKSDDQLTAGMSGVRSPVLHLDNLEVGDYTFTLKVTDTSGQSDTADVHVFVKPGTNHPPVAKTAGHLSLFLPQDSLTLDGSNSSGHAESLEFSWTQTAGPSTLTIANADKKVAIATGKITEGEYQFKLTVTDGEQQKSSSTLTLTLKNNVNFPPKASAGGDKEVEGPVSLLVLDGSKSTDDRAITKYLWTRDSKSLAAGTIVNNSDHKAVLQLVNLIAGQYMFKLTVEDVDGLSSSDTARLTVKTNKHERDFVEMILDTDIDRFTLADKESLQDQLELLLQTSSEDRSIMVEFVAIQEDLSSGHLCVRFLARRDWSSNPDSSDQSQVVSGTDALSTIKSKLVSEKILDYQIVRLDLVVCQNNCSGHGYCHQATKLCICEAFWMPNFFISSLFGSQTNCDWSVLYVIIICFIIVVTIVSLIWALICCFTSRKCKLKIKPRRRHRYSLLRDADNDNDKDKYEMMTKNKIQNSSLMISESDLSSDEETLFISNKKTNGTNGRLANGVRTHYSNNLKT